MVTKDTIIKAMQSQKNLFFSVWYIKENGDLRKAAAQNIELDPRLENNNVINYFDLNKKGVRRFRVDRIVAILGRPIEEFNPSDFE